MGLVPGDATKSKKGISLKFESCLEASLKDAVSNNTWKAKMQIVAKASSHKILDIEDLNVLRIDVV